MGNVLLLFLLVLMLPRLALLMVMLPTSCSRSSRFPALPLSPAFLLLLQPHAAADCTDADRAGAEGASADHAEQGLQCDFWVRGSRECAMSEAVVQDIRPSGGTLGIPRWHSCAGTKD